jgi:hypothetical protein
MPTLHCTAGEKSLVGLSILGLICLVLSAYMAVPVSIAWMASNTVGAERALAIGLQVSLGGVGGLAGSFIYIGTEGPKYPTGTFELRWSDHVRLDLNQIPSSRLLHKSGNRSIGHYLRFRSQIWIPAGEQEA